MVWFSSTTTQRIQQRVRDREKSERMRRWGTLKSRYIVQLFIRRATGIHRFPISQHRTHSRTHTHLPAHSRIKVLDVMLCTKTETDCLIKCKLVSRQMRIYPLCIYSSQFSITRTQCIHCVLIFILLVVVVAVVVFFFRCLFAVPCGSLASTRRARSIQQFIERLARTNEPLYRPCHLWIWLGESRDCSRESVCVFLLLLSRAHSHLVCRLIHINLIG